MPQKFYKSPEAVSDYSVEWELWLKDGENIATSEWEVADGIEYANAGVVNTLTYLYLSGGTIGKTYTIKNIITTDSPVPRTDSRSFKVQIANR